jgi:hypothetical protein
LAKAKEPVCCVNARRRARRQRDLCAIVHCEDQPADKVMTEVASRIMEVLTDLVPLALGLASLGAFLGSLRSE